MIIELLDYCCFCMLKEGSKYKSKDCQKGIIAVRFSEGHNMKRVIEFADVSYSAV